MPRVSDRGLRVPQSPIRKLVPYAEAAKKRGIKIYHLNIGQPDINTPETALDAVRKYEGKILEYSHSAGNESYRRGLAKYYNNIGIDIDYKNILVTTGGSEAVLFAFQACLDQGDELIIPEPFYTNYNSFAIATSTKIVPIGSSIETGFALPPIAEFEKLITEKTKAIMICNPNNPTGYVYSAEELEQLRKLVIKHDLYLIADEVYREFCYDGMVHKSVLQLEGLEQHAIVVDSVSKRYSECGVRIGCIVSRNSALNDAVLKFAMARLSPPGLGQIAAEASLDTPKSYFDEVYEEYKARRNYVVDALNKIPGVYSPMPKGAFYTIVKLPIDDAEKFSRWLLETFNYNNKTVMLAPANGFYASKGRGKNEVRLAYVLNIEDLKSAIECLEEALKVYPGKIDE
ncbi:MAG: aspartate aminotransferase [Bacteroidia bacterium]|nr:MAG: aspartate aminotransferase [Bacteroidia bacterium]